MLSATSLAGLSLQPDGELTLEVDLDREVSEEDKAGALEIKAKANKAFAGMRHFLHLYTAGQLLLRVVRLPRGLAACLDDMVIAD
jgi:hypothetical protein